eukprot:TRINITY_DN2476_c0_g1_i1.p1 TRINITY_DN2476_c0_g1~~TRINITY_DN2476_c0_g1_i1.p1  ORF type:complete len:594 (-),score=130.74 TRINITY_DN2476_c0_g1_i1:128-1909(-)
MEECLILSCVPTQSGDDPELAVLASSGAASSLKGLHRSPGKMSCRGNSLDRAQSPAVQRPDYWQVEAPSTPSMDSKRSKANLQFGAPSPENQATHDPAAPVPHRAYLDPVHTTYEHERPIPGSPWSVTDDAAQQELRELFVAHAKPVGQISGVVAAGRLPLEGRPLSSVSTSAGPTPSPDERFSPAHQCSPGPPSKSPTPTPQAGSPSPSQVRKVFVGGIPQDMTQDDLYDSFSEHAPVKKAWLQRYRPAPGSAGTPNAASQPPHNHRGFGFVIFHDSSAVDDLLGKDFSRFFTLKDGRRLEVKRAMSSNDMNSEKGGQPTKATKQGKVSEQAQQAQPQALSQSQQQASVPLQQPKPRHANSQMVQQMQQLQQPQQLQQLQQSIPAQAPQQCGTPTPTLVPCNMMGCAGTMPPGACWPPPASPVPWNAQTQIASAPQGRCVSPVLIAPVPWAGMDASSARMQTQSPPPMQQPMQPQQMQQQQQLHQPQPVMYPLQMGQMTASAPNGAVAWVQRSSSPQLPQLTTGQLSPVPQWPATNGNVACQEEHPHPAVAFVARHAASLGAEQQQTGNAFEAQRNELAALLVSAMPDHYAE